MAYATPLPKALGGLLSSYIAGIAFGIFSVIGLEALLLCYQLWARKKIFQFALWGIWIAIFMFGPMFAMSEFAEEFNLQQPSTTFTWLGVLSAYIYLIRRKYIFAAVKRT